jgi:DNA-binding winged helix-turn-helix (wHTH) protein
MGEHARMNSRPARDIVSIGAFRLLPSRRLLMKDDEPVKLGARAFDILLVLADRPGEVVSQKDLIARVWPNVFVEDVSLRVHVAALRKVFNCDGTRYLANVPGRGYSLVAPVSRTVSGEVSESDAVIEPTYPLPPPLARMVRRREDEHEIREKVLSQRFVTVVGPGGVGKTAFALSVAHVLVKEFLGAVCFVELSPIGLSQALGATVVSAFHLPVQSRDPLPDLIAHLGGKHILLVLDGCEQFREGFGSRDLLKAKQMVERIESGVQYRLDAEFAAG